MSFDLRIKNSLQVNPCARLLLQNPQNLTVRSDSFAANKISTGYLLLNPEPSPGSLRVVAAAFAVLINFGLNSHRRQRKEKLPRENPANFPNQEKLIFFE